MLFLLEQHSASHSASNHIYGVFPSPLCSTEANDAWQSPTQGAKIPCCTSLTHHDSLSHRCGQKDKKTTKKVTLLLKQCQTQYNSHKNTHTQAQCATPPCPSPSIASRLVRNVSQKGEGGVVRTCRMCVCVHVVEVFVSG